MKIYENVLELIGNTPLVRLNKLADGNIFVKIESKNPAGSIKDRVAFNMLNEAIKKGFVDKDTLIIEPTSGNTGIGLALCCAVKDLRLILTMPENMSEERKKLLKFLGAKLVLTPCAEGMNGAVKKAEELSKENPNSFIPMQFSNEDNPKAHENSTAIEIFEDTDANVDLVVAGIGTGGTISGLGKKLKELKKNVEMIGVEPFESPLITKNKVGKHGIQGIGANFIPDNYNPKFIDKVLTCKTQDAIKTAKLLAKKEGILAGISGGCALFVALELARKENYANKNIVVILPDSAEKYMTTELFDEV